MFAIIKIVVLLFALHVIPGQPVHPKAPVAIPACDPNPYQQGSGGGC